MKRIAPGLLALLVIVVSTSCTAAPASECIARGALAYRENRQGLSKLFARFNELNTSQSEKVKFLKGALRSEQLSEVDTCQFGSITKETNLANLEPFHAEEQCMAWPYRVVTTWGPSYRERYDRFVETACRLEIPGAIEVNSFGMFTDYRGSPPAIMLPPKTSKD